MKPHNLLQFIMSFSKLFLLSTLCFCHIFGLETSQTYYSIKNNNFDDNTSNLRYIPNDDNAFEAEFDEHMYIEVYAVVDKSVLMHHNNDTDLLQRYIVYLIDLVNDIYQDLRPDVHFVLVDLLLLQQHVLNTRETAKDALNKVNNFMANNNKGFDVSVWLTRVDLGGASGLAPLTGACDQHRSCALIRDDGMNSAFVMAHELGHLLGLSHDDENCGQQIGSIMNQLVDANFNSFFWSTCSASEFEAIFRNGQEQNNCLFNRKSSHKINFNHNNDFGRTSAKNDMFTLDEQCQLEFGEDHRFCTAFPIEDVCEQLWCSSSTDTSLCKQKSTSPIAGTSCGPNKKCYRNKCQDDIRWVTGPWEECSHSCGKDGKSVRNVVCFNHNNNNDDDNESNKGSKDELGRLRRIVHPSHCRRRSGPAPPRSRPCNIQPCSNNGILKRNETELIKPKEINLDGFVKVCRERDASVLCHEPVLMRYCIIPSYRDLCCLTCTQKFRID